MQEYIYDKDNLISLIDEKQHSQLKLKLSVLNEVDIADFIDSLPDEQKILAFTLSPKDLAADVFANLESNAQESLISSLNDRQLMTIIEELSIDDMVDMLGDLPANMVKRILQNAKPETRRLVNKFLRFPEDSAGSIMTAEFIDLKKEYTVAQAIAKIKRLAPEMETIYTVYVTDKQRRLEGTASFKDLLIAPDNVEVSSIMEKNVISVHTTDDQETAANLLQKYGFLSLPVVDNEDRLVGIVTVDDAADVIEEETTEDFEKMAALNPSDKPYLKTSIISLAKNRIMWLLVLMISGMLTGAILGMFESAFVAIPILVTFIPMLTGTGGNAGSQASMLVIRGMALDEVRPRDFLKVFWKELRVSLIVGVILGAVNFLRIYFFFDHQVLIALTVSLAMCCTVILAKTVGSLLPLLAKVLKIDPALMAAPLISTIVDAVSLVIFFMIANQILGL